MSASAPAGIASSMTGMLSAASTSATIDGDEESDVISQPAPTSCIHVPTFETIVAIHSPRNSRFCSGLQGDAATPTPAVLALSLIQPPYDVSADGAPPPLHRTASACRTRRP